MRYEPLPPETLKIRRGLSGLGLISLKSIKKGQTIVEYIGKRVNDAKADTLSNRYIFEVKKNVNIDGSSHKNLARYVNHSCKPNCDYSIRKSGRVFYYALKRIQAGEELTVDYGKEYFDYYIAPKGCRCGAKKHRHQERKKRHAKNPA